MKNSFMLSIALPLLLLLGGCSSRPEKLLYQGNYNGQDYVVKSYQTSGFYSSRTDWLVKLGKLPELPINVIKWRGSNIPLDGEVTTDWGPPYSDDLYGNHRRSYFYGMPSYSNAGDDYSARERDLIVPTMLYVSGQLSQDQYLQYVRFMKAEWAKVDKAIAEQESGPRGNFPRIVGLVHGSRQLFIRRYRGTIQGVRYVMRIDPDGFVNFGEDDASAELNHMRHFRVQMPGKIIVLHQIYTWHPYTMTRADVVTFRDSEGRSPEFFFDIKD